MYIFQFHTMLYLSSLNTAQREPKNDQFSLSDDEIRSLGRERHQIMYQNKLNEIHSLFPVRISARHEE